jgi:thiol:disulfide interchange protein DsbC
MQTASRRWSATLMIYGLFMAISLNSNATDSSDNYAEVRAAISQLIPGLNGMEIQPSAIENMLEVRANTRVFYVSSDGGFLLQGPLYALGRGENLTEKRLAEYRKILLKDISAIQPVEYPADNAKQKIIVITDIDCPYCRRLHQELDKYHQIGLDIDYVMLPRSGKDSPSYVKTVNAICAAQPDVAITAAMNGETPASAECDHPIDQHMEMARALGVSSTPSLVLPDGRLIVGYKTAAEISRLLVAASQD